MPSVNDEEDKDGVANEASSREKDHEDRVKALCNQLWPSKSNTFQIDWVQEGGFHQHTAITVDFHSKQTPLRLILREKQVDFPSSSSFEDEVAVLRYLGQHTSLPVPKVEVVDFSANNALENAYVVISQIPGHDLDHLDSGKYLGGLSQQSRCSVAKDWAKMLLEIQATSGPMPGRIKCIDNGDGTQTFEVVPFQRKRVPGQGSKGLFDDCFVDEAGVELPGASQLAQKIPFRSTLDWFLSQFERRKNPHDPLSVIHFECLAAVATQIDAAGYMGSNQYTIYHPGLLQSPGNVMIELGADESLNISGILDWDSAVFHPSFHGCEIPVWLWDGEYSYDAYGNLIEETPATIEQQQIKQAFENAVGAEYLHRAPASSACIWIRFGAATDSIGGGGPTFGLQFQPRREGMPQIQRIEKAPSNNEVDSEEEFEVDGIVDARRFAGGHVKYLIKWTGYEEPTWQPYSDISHLEDELRAFEAACPLKPIHRKRAQHLRRTRAKFRRR